MSRKKTVIHRVPVGVDAKFNDAVMIRFINNLMVKGKKSTAEQVFYGALDKIAERNKDNKPLDIFRKAIDNVKPYVEVKSRRVGGSTYQVPVEVRSDRKVSLAIRWLILNSRIRREKTMMDNLASELIDASKGLGGAVKKKEDTHKMAEANKAFAHYRW